MAGLLREYIEKTRNDPFEWGKSDCALWVADYVRECTGIDPASSVRGQYNSKYSAKRFMSFRGGFVSLCSHMMRDFEPGEDAVIVEYQGRLAAGLKSGDGVAIKDANGFGILNNPNILRGWKVWSN